jgi:UDP-N-acetylmuramoylalanine--D-glutamate ligase
MEDFTECDIVIKAAGVPLHSPYIEAARNAGVPVYMSTALFAKFAMDMGATIVGITGTRGKSTVTQMIYHGLIRTNVRTVLGGNVRGVSTLALLPRIKKDDVAVLELDSWQLQGFGDLQISPQIAVFTNLMPDHLNYYKDMDEYFNDKANIFKFQKRPSEQYPQGDELICGAEIAERIKKFLPPVSFKIPHAIPAEWKLQIPGEHNRKNASLAVEALRAFKLSEEEIRAGIESFTGVEGRLQLVREINGVKIYNDNNATTPDATIVALKALKEKNKNIILIMGGADKGLDMSALVSEINTSCKEIIFLAGTGTDSFLEARSSQLAAPPHAPYNNLKDAVTNSLDLATSGDTILFSPAFASFGLFKNEYERNDIFMSIIMNLS